VPLEIWKVVAEAFKTLITSWPVSMRFMILSSGNRDTHRFCTQGAKRHKGSILLKNSPLAKLRVRINKFFEGGQLVSSKLLR